MQSGSTFDHRYDYEIDDRLIKSLETRYGEFDFLKILAQAYPGNSEVNTYIDTVLALRNRPYQREAGDPSPRGWDYVQLQQKFQEGLSSPWWTFRQWGHKCTASDLRRAAADLSTQTDPIKLQSYLWIFSKRPFPLDPALLFPFTDHANPRIKGAAFGALEQLTHPSVRAFALNLIQTGINTDYAIALLEANFQPGDWPLIEELTSRSFADLDSQHRVQMHSKYIAKAHPGPESVRSLRNLYELGPCAFCRRQVVKLLMEHDALSDSMREECEYDSNFDTRRLIQGDQDEPEDAPV